MRIRQWVRIRELPWIVLSILRKGLVSAVPIRAHLGIARLRGWAYGRIERVPDHILQNLKATVVGESLELSELEQIARQNIEFRRSRYVTRILSKLPGFNDSRRWPVHGLEYLDNALNLGRGVMLISAHFGRAPLIAPILRTHGYDVIQVSASFKVLERNLRRDQWLASGSELRRYVFRRTRVFRDRTDPGRIPANLDVRPIITALARKQTVIVAGDGMRAANFENVVLLGRSFPLPTGFMKIAMMTKASVLPVFAIEGDHRNPVVVEIKPALPIDPTASVSQNLQLFANVFDEQLRRSPHLWIRWRVNNFFDKAHAWSESDVSTRYNAKWEKHSLRVSPQ